MKTFGFFLRTFLRKLNNYAERKEFRQAIHGFSFSRNVLLRLFPLKMSARDDFLEIKLLVTNALNSIDNALSAVLTAIDTEGEPEDAPVRLAWIAANNAWTDIPFWGFSGGLYWTDLIQSAITTLDDLLDLLGEYPSEQSQLEIAYNNFTGSGSRDSGGGGANGQYGQYLDDLGLLPRYPDYDCENPEHVPYDGVLYYYYSDPRPQPGSEVFLFPLLGTCSKLLHANLPGYGEGYYLYVARAVEIWIYEKMGILGYYNDNGVVKPDNGETPYMPELPDDLEWDTYSAPIGFYTTYENNVESEEFRCVYDAGNWADENINPAGHPWPFQGSTAGWPYGYPYQAIPVIVNNPGPNQSVKYLRDVDWQVEGKDGSGFWQYRLCYWIAKRIIYDVNIDNNPALPDVLQFTNPCPPPDPDLPGGNTPFFPLPILLISSQIMNKGMMGIDLKKKSSQFGEHTLTMNNEALVWEGQETISYD